MLFRSLMLLSQLGILGIGGIHLSSLILEGIFCTLFGSSMCLLSRDNVQGQFLRMFQ